MNSDYHEVVLYPITVAFGDFCWGPGPEPHTHRICTHFDTEGGHPVCNFGIGQLSFDIHGDVPKPKRCLNLRKGGTE